MVFSFGSVANFVGDREHEAPASSVDGDKSVRCRVSGFRAALWFFRGSENGQRGLADQPRLRRNRATCSPLAPRARLSDRVLRDKEEMAEKAYMAAEDVEVYRECVGLLNGLEKTLVRKLPVSGRHVA